MPHLREGAMIVNTGSITGLEGLAELVDYTTTKELFTHLRITSTGFGSKANPSELRCSRPGLDFPQSGGARKLRCGRVWKGQPTHAAPQPEAISLAFSIQGVLKCRDFKGTDVSTRSGKHRSRNETRATIALERSPPLRWTA
jgi:hypothetical protein